MKRGQSLLQLLGGGELIEFAVIAIVIAFLAFGGLGLLNSVTMIFGVNILNPVLQGIAQPVALILGLYLVARIVLSLLNIAFPKKDQASPNPLTFAILMGITAFLLDFGLTGSIAPFSITSTGQQVPNPNYIPINYAYLLGGILVGMAVVFIVELAIKEIYHKKRRH
jgi:hypothetical protein